VISSAGVVPLGSRVDHNFLCGTASGGESCGYWDSTAGTERVDHTFSCRSEFEPSPGLIRLDRTFHGTTGSGSGSDAYGAALPFNPQAAAKP
jgi:hypothetical protein